MTLSILSTLLVYTAWVALDRLTFSRLYPGIEPSFILRMESKFLVKWSLSGQGSLRKLPSWSPHPQLWGSVHLPAALLGVSPFFPRHTDFLSSGGRQPTVIFSAIPRHREPCGYSVYSRLAAGLAAAYCPVQQGSIGFVHGYPK